MKKLILIFNIFITVITLSSCESPHQQESTTSFESSCVESGETIIDTQEPTSIDDLSSKIICVQERVSKIIDEDCFQNSSLNDKVQLVEPVLNDLIEQGYITDYQIKLEQQIPSITLFYDGGATSTILLEDFPDDAN